MLPYLFFPLAYAVFLLVSQSFFDAQTGLDARILSPILLTSLILVVSGLARWLPRLPAGLRGSILLAAALLAGGHVISGVEMARILYGGQNKGYAGAEWTGMKLLQQIRGFPQDTLIYSNGQDVIYLLTGRPATGIPKVRSPNSLRANPRFEEEMQVMQAALARGNGILVVFNELQERRRYLPSEYDLNELLPLERITRWQKEGTVYRLREEGD
jgi:hypothetical protein